MELEEIKQDLVHIRVQQRNNKKNITTIQGLTLDLPKLVKTFKKLFSCNVFLVEDRVFGTIIQLQGDQRQGVLDFITKNRIIDPKFVRIHGY